MSTQTEQNRMFLLGVKKILYDNGHSYQSDIDRLMVGNDGVISTKSDDCDLLLIDGGSIPHQIKFDRSVVVGYPHQSLSDIRGDCDKEFDVEILKWSSNPNMDDEWKTSMIENIGIVNFNKEYIT